MAYSPTIPPEFDNVSGLREWIVAEFERLARELAETTAVELRLVHVAPTRPREGMIISADGTDWNPGAGAGAYEFIGGAWVKL